MNKDQDNIIFCTNCGGKNSINNKFCIHCGSSLNIFNPQTMTTGYNYQNYMPNPNNNINHSADKKISVMVILGLVILFLFSYSILEIIGIILSGIVLTLYILYGKANNGFGITLKVIGIIGLFLIVSVLILLGMCFAALN